MTSISNLRSSACTQVQPGYRATTDSDGLRTGEEACPKGMFSLGADDSCSPCGSSSFTDQEGQSTCTNVQPGYESITDTSGELVLRTGEEACPKGTFSLGADACTPCTNSSFTDVTGQSACKIVQPGYQTTMDSDGLRVGEEACLPGTYSLGADTCEACATGTVSDAPASTACKVCEPGTSTKPDQTACEVCVEGKSSGLGSDSCSLCGERIA